MDGLLIRYITEGALVHSSAAPAIKQFSETIIYKRATWDPCMEFYGVI